MSFKDSMDADLDEVFFNEDDFAEAATYYPLGVDANAYALSVIFDNEYHSVETAGTVNIQATAPNVRVKTTDLQAKVSVKDEILVAGIRYLVRTDEPDGVGTTLLTLRKK